MYQPGSDRLTSDVCVCRYYSPRPAIGQYCKEKDDFVYLSFGEVFEMVRSFGSGLKKLMADKNCSESMVSMASISRLEWYLTDLTCLLLSIPTVSL